MKSSIIYSLIIGVIFCINHKDSIVKSNTTQFDWPPQSTLKYKVLDVQTPKIKQGIICRAEDRIYKNSKMGVSFRLGGLQYVNQLERNN